MKEAFTLVGDLRVAVRPSAETQVRVLVADVAALMADEALQASVLSALSPQRRSRAEAMGNPRSRALSIGAALLLDRLLGEHGLRERDMSYTTGPHGKPAFATEGGLLFNLSHSGHLAAAAVVEAHAGMALGLDVQRITRYRPEVVRRVFTPEDRARLGACTSETERQRLFARLWCRAEAYAKATGDGLQWPFPTPPADAAFTDLDIDADYCAALCLLTQKD